jgi:hypothetical protein
VYLVLVELTDVQSDLAIVDDEFGGSRPDNKIQLSRFPTDGVN